MSDPFVGEIRLFAGNFAPQNWALCDGSTLSIAEFEVLFDLIGTTYGGDGQSNFKLPDLRSRTPIHFGPGRGWQHLCPRGPARRRRECDAHRCASRRPYAPVERREQRRQRALPGRRAARLVVQFASGDVAIWDRRVGADDIDGGVDPPK